MASVLTVASGLVNTRKSPEMRPDYVSGTVDLKTLFSTAHYQGKTLFHHLLFITYLPFGVSLVLIRIWGALALLVVALVTNTLRITQYIFTPWNRLQLLKLFGFWPRFHNTLAFYKEPDTVILASNHRTAFDLLPFMLFAPFDVMIDKQFYESSWISRAFLRQIEVFVGAVKVERLEKENRDGRQRQKDSVVGHVKSTKRPLLFFPEGWDTNGQTGLLAYQPFLFSLDIPIVPVALNVYVPILPLVPGKLGTSIGIELLWFFFTPVTFFDISFLPAQNIAPGEDSPAFAKRVQTRTAEILNIFPTDWTKHDALTYRKSLMTGAKA